MHRNDALAERLLEFSVRIMRLVRALPKDQAARHVARQLLRAGTSPGANPGANYAEARGAESKRDFVHKLGIVLKELKETRYWLRLAAKAELIKDGGRLGPLLEEAEQLVAIFGKSVHSSREADLAGVRS